MNVVLVRCRAGGGPRETNVTGCYPPLGLAYLGAVLEPLGHNVALIDAEALGLDAEGIAARMPSRPEVIGFTATTLLWPAVRAAAADLQKRFPNACLIVGGPHVTAFPETTLDASVFDFGVLGEAEHTLPALIDRVQRGRPADDLPGCVIRSNGQVRTTGPVQWVRDLDTLPFPARHLLPVNAYHSVLALEPFVTMVTSRGCPYRCDFCSQIYSGNTLRRRSPQNIVDEMAWAVNRHGAREIILFDETFGVDRRDALRVCELIRARNLRVRWNARTRIDVLDRELLSSLRDAGCYALHLGVESGVQRVLDMMNKGIRIEQVRETVRAARKLGFRLHAYFMLGYPGETRRDIKRTLRFSRELGLDWASYTITVPNPCTPLARRASEDGTLEPGFWDAYTRGHRPGALPCFASASCPQRFVQRAKRNAYARFYLRPRILWRNLRFFAAAGGWRRTFRALALWFREEWW